MTKIPKYLPWLVIFSASLFFFYEFIEMQMFNAISHSLLSDFHISATTLGYLSSSYFLADVFFLFPAGMLLDRYSPRKIILCAMWISVISTVFFARAHSIVVIAICHFAAGIGNAFCLLSCIRIASRWFSTRQMALVIGLIVTFGMFGGMVAQTPLAWLIIQVGWRDALMATAGIGFVIILLIWKVVKDYPAGQKEKYEEQHRLVKNMGVKESIRRTFMNSQNWFCGCYTSCMNIPLMLLGGLWGSLYLTTLHQLTRIQASYVTSMLFLGTMIGCPVIGALSDRLARRRSPMIIFGVLSLPVMAAIIYLSPLSLTWLMVLFFALGFITAAQTVGYPTISESNDASMSGTALALAALIVMGAPLFFEPFYGYLMDKNWDGKIANGIHIYNAHAYHESMVMLLMVLFVGLLSSFFIKETFAREK